MPAKDAIALLKEDHEMMKDIMSQIDETTTRAVKKREELLAKMKDELTTHERIEEEIFYPALREQEAKSEEIVLEAYEEHHAVDVLLDELQGVPVDDESWSAKFTVIRENIEHHIEEEEGEMFKQARKVFDRDMLTDLGRRMEELKRRIHASV